MGKGRTLRIGPAGRWLLLAVALGGLGLALPRPGGGEQPSLQETLENGLKARRPAEFAFIGRVVRLVDKRVLPRALVESTYLWARRQKAAPFPYFESGLRLRAKKIGVAL